jgi:hypothetical protein
MRELIGVRGLHNIILEDLKRDFLIFDKIYIIGLKEVLFDIKEEKSHLIVRPYIDFIVYDFYRSLYANNKKVPEYIHYMLNEMEYLIDQGKIVLDYHEVIPKFNTEQIKPCFEASSRISNYALKTKPQINNVDDYATFISLIHELSVREKTYYMNQNIDVEAYPIIEKFTTIKELETKKQIIAIFAINKFPIPDENTSWEQIFDFKNDPESIGSLMGLKAWINKISKSNLDINECVEEFEYLSYEYEKSIKLHKLKMQNSIFETTIVSGTELIENIAKLKLGKIAKSLFKARKEQIELMEIELKSAGSELSYIIKANKEFKK